MLKKLLIKNGLVVCPEQGIVEKLDVLIKNSKIIELKKNITNSDANIINAKGKIVIPGLVDIHSHLREPGREDVATIKTEVESASAGGYTSIACMPNTNPPIDDKRGVIYVNAKGKEAGLTNVYSIASATKGLEGNNLTNISMLVEAGAVAISDAENTIINSSVMKCALEYIRMFNIPIISHCEDNSLSENGCINESYVSTSLGLKGIPYVAEEIMVARDIALTKYTNSILHIAHITTASSVRLIRKAKKDGIRVSCEVSPHHFTLTENDIINSSYNSNFKVTPPLRTEKDKDAVIDGLIDGTIDCIATDHSPWLDNEKDMEFIEAPSGIVGFETALPLVFTNLINTKKLSLLDAISKITLNPAKIINLNKGTLSIGSTADITIIDPELEITIDLDFFHSTSKNSPFIGKTLKGYAIYTIIEGNIIYDRTKNMFFPKKK